MEVVRARADRTGGQTPEGLRRGEQRSPLVSGWEMGGALVSLGWVPGEKGEDGDSS